MLGQLTAPGFVEPTKNTHYCPASHPLYTNTMTVH